MEAQEEREDSDAPNIQDASADGAHNMMAEPQNMVYTEEEFNNDIELNDEWQDDDLLSSDVPSARNDRLKFGIAAKPDRLQLEGKSQKRRKVSLQLSVDEDLSKYLDSEDMTEIDHLPTPDELLTPDDFDLDSSCADTPRRMVGVDLEWDNDTPILASQNGEGRSAFTESSISSESSVYRTVVIGEEEFKMDLSAIIPYKQVLSHGGYYGEGLNAIVVFSACYLPDCHQTDYDYIMDNLFLYVVSTLDLLVAEEYMIVFFNGGCKRRNVPNFTWMKRCYKMIHRRLRKNLKQLLVVHPSWFMRALITFFRPFISSKFSRKLKLVSSLKELAQIVTLTGVSVPDAVNSHDARRYPTSRRVKVKRSPAKNSDQNSSTSQDVHNGDDSCGATAVSAPIDK